MNVPDVVTELLSECERAGLVVYLDDGGGARVRGRGVTDELKNRLALHKAAIVARLKGEDAAPTGRLVCLKTGGVLLLCTSATVSSEFAAYHRANPAAAVAAEYWRGGENQTWVRFLEFKGERV